MKKTIAIVAGGDSSEHVVSLRSAQGIWSFMNHDKYDTYIITIKGTDWKMVEYDGHNYDTSRTLRSYQDAIQLLRSTCCSFDMQQIYM